jgi:DNA-binding NtrC family response regulator
MSGSGGVKTLLVIDDDRIFCAAVKDYFTGNALQVLVAHSGGEGLAICEQRKVDVLLLDQHLPDREGHTICPAILRANEECKIIFITAHPSFANALKAIECGACEYLSKPFELEELRLAVEKALRTLRLEKVEQVQNYKLDRESETKRLIGSGGGLAETMRMVDLAAAVDSPVLITGETGTGKNLVAETIHFKGPNPRAPFIGINCAGLPENLVESELFGYEKGAFTGATASRKGIFEMAEGGTLFLDEIGEIPLHLQAKLLTAVEEKKIRRVGGESIRPVDVRIIASTSVALESVLGSSFRKDLYYRLNVIRIHLPPLRERRQDIPELSAHLLKVMAGGGEVRLAAGELERLQAYAWPGNVRELRNVLERAFILQKDRPALSPAELLSPAEGSTRPRPHSADTDRDGSTRPSPPSPGAENRPATLMELEKDHIQSTLAAHSRNYTQTARSLGISLTTLKRKIKEYHL